MFKKLKEKHYQLGFNEGYKKGFDQGLDFSQEYYESSQVTENKQPEVKTNIKILNDLDDFLSWLKVIHEICDTRFFSNYLFENRTAKEMEDMILYIDYLSQTTEISYVYPEVYNMFPDLIMSLHDVMKNKEMIEEISGGNK